ncbi:hypothetical protein, partial [Hymenobacter agri]
MLFRILLLGAALAVAPGPLCAQKTASKAPPATAPAIIEGNITGVPDSTNIAVFEPLPGVPMNFFFTDGPNEAVVRGGHFRYQLQHAGVGFVRFNGQVVPRGMPFVEPGARITFRLAAAAG